MKIIPVDDVVFDQEQRIRQQTRTAEGRLKVESLKQSMKQFGQLVPILVNPIPDSKLYKLIDGERRLSAAKELGWETIDAILHEVDQDEEEALEIITTLERESFTWQDEVKAKARLHELMCKIVGRSTTHLRVPGGWTIENTAKVLNQHKGNISKDLKLARALEEVPEVAKKNTKTAALKFLRRRDDLAFREALAASIQEEQRWTLHEGDCLEILPAIPDESVDLILTDPPFGVIDDNDMSWRDWRAQGLVYSDNRGEYSRLMQSFVQEAYRVLKPGRHMYIFCGWEFVTPMKEWLQEAGFETPGPPAVWLRQERVKFTHMDRFATDHYSIVFAAKPYPDVKNFRWQEMSRFQMACITDIPPVVTRREHPAEAPVALFKLFLELSSVPGELVLDAFAGSGSCGVASLQLGRRWLGIELDHNWCNLITVRLDNVTGADKNES